MSAATSAISTNPGPPPDRIVIINDASVARGGATGLALLSAKLFRARGLSVTYITGDGGPGDAHRDLDGVDVIAFARGHILTEARSKAMIRGLYDFGVHRDLGAWIVKNDTPRTIYHLHGWSKSLSPSVLHALSSVGARTVVHAHDFFLTCPTGGYFNYGAQTPCELKPLGVKCLTTHCDRRSYVHKVWRSARLGALAATGARLKAARYLAVHPNMTPLLVKGGLPADRVFGFRNPSTAWRSDRVPAEANQMFLFVGRLERDKGVLFLAEACRRAEVPLTLVGDGELNDDLARDYPEVVRLGRKTPAELSEIVRDARALVLLSTGREPYGLVYFEAGMSGLPLVSTQFAMAAEELGAEEIALIVNPFDVDEIAATLRRLASDDALAARMSATAFSKSAALTYTPDAWIDALLKHYDETLAQAGGAGVASRSPGSPDARSEPTEAAHQKAEL